MGMNILTAFCGRRFVEGEFKSEGTRNKQAVATWQCVQLARLSAAVPHGLLLQLRHTRWVTTQ